MARVPDTDSQPIEPVFPTQCADDIPDAVVAAVAASFPEPCHTDVKINLIVGHQHMLWLDLKELAQGSDGFSTVIHEGGRKQQFNVMSIDTDTAEFAEKFTFATE